ncbi:hypothetical protein SAMN02799631_00325 [Methylobacterium sp. 174MFSha1.1]|uniref:hypothetical protein n=1 Tax=Methylobacterium sp. 174MFSha1.1 TaxID=1502749 RepID=UPI0008F20214|nr:hypothetical protein [Methylobacterium sp. 174MFSha1.1]SFU35681.1 hypothetical protein SAMN02799631_00325 [Methylobacterium sp. 174MFSha1.1]
MTRSIDLPHPAAGGNGSPPLDERDVDIIARIGKAMYGRWWIGPVAEDLGHDHQVVRRWLKGQGTPSQKDIDWMRLRGRRMAAQISRECER